MLRVHIFHQLKSNQERKDNKRKRKENIEYHFQKCESKSHCLNNFFLKFLWYIHFLYLFVIHFLEL